MSWKITNEEIVTIGGNWFWQSMTGLFRKAYTTEPTERRTVYIGGRTCVQT